MNLQERVREIALPVCDGVCDPALISLLLPVCLSLGGMIAYVILPPFFLVHEYFM